MSNKTILIVDDSPVNVRILDELLVDFRKKVATSGMKALEIAGSESPPDIILLDIEMPGMNGFQICRELKKNPLTSHIPVIFITSKTDKKTTIEGFKLGASDFMTKPFNHEELMARVNTQLDLADARQKLESTVRQMEISSTLLKKAGEELNRKNILSDSLLLNILPEYVARELKEFGQVVPRHYSLATVLFADLVGFSRISKSLNPKEVIHELTKLFTGFDEILQRNNMEKIKTIGDGYMAAGGIPIPNDSNPTDAVRAGLMMIEFVKDAMLANKSTGKPLWEVRVGIHTGELIAGVIGKNKFAYDIWGDTVNAASRMESLGKPGRVNISGITYQFVKGQFKCTPGGKVEAKNMGKMDLYFCDCEISVDNYSNAG
jgi:adenylate cyclase